MIKVRLRCNWTDDFSLREYFNSFSLDLNYTWKDMFLVEDELYDYVVIFNYVTDENFEKSKTILFQCEPTSTRKWWKYKDINEYYRVYDTDTFFNFVTPHVFTPYKQIIKDKPNKDKLFCGICSDYQVLDGHKPRKQFVDNYLCKISYYDHYGKGSWGHIDNFKGFCHNKYKCLSQYKYHFNAENSFEDNYFTEKLIDAILAECLCFYDGCANIEQFIDPRAYVKIDLKNPEKSINIVKECISNNEYDRRIEYIKRAKQTLLTEQNPMNIIYKAITK